MNKSELMTAVAEKAGLPKEEAEAVLASFVEVTKEALKKGDKVQLIGFGTFEAVPREARTGRNPRTGETISIPAVTVPKFKAGKALKDAVN